MASWSVLAAVDGLLLRGCVVACETDRSAQAKSVEYLTRFVHTLPLADTPLAAPRACRTHHIDFRELRVPALSEQVGEEIAWKLNSRGSPHLAASVSQQ